MKLTFSVAAILALAVVHRNIRCTVGLLPHRVVFSSSRAALQPLHRNNANHPLSVSFADKVDTAESTTDDTSITVGSILKMKYRDLQRSCKERGLGGTGDTAQLRNRLLESIGESPRDPLHHPPLSSTSPSSTPEELVTAILESAERGHWKKAVRRLKQLNKMKGSVSLEVYESVLKACAEDRLAGARAAESARKVMENMVRDGCQIPVDIGNECVTNCIGRDSGGTHENFGGIDTALAMLATMEASGCEVFCETYEVVVDALSRDEAIDEAVLLLRAMVVERSFTPSLVTLGNAAKMGARMGLTDAVMTILSLAKAAGYKLDTVAVADSGRDLLAAGLIAAEKIDNLQLGLRLLTAAQNADCRPDPGDLMVSCSSPGAQRAATLIHRRSIEQAVKTSNWKLAVRILELMPRRGITPSTAVWRKVVTLCAKSEKSRKGTALLRDWVTLSEGDKVAKPPLSVFNTVVNACEICGEEELTVAVLELMKKTVGTDGDIVTFNIAMKRLAKLGNFIGCEGILIGMLQQNVEPNVVSYTTTIAACAQAKNSAMAVEWLRRMQSRGIRPNYHTYNTVFASCLDGSLESTKRASAVAAEMMAAVDQEVVIGLKGNANLKSVVPDTYSKKLARDLMKQLRQNWRDGEIDMRVAKATVRPAFLTIVDFDRSETFERVQKDLEEALGKMKTEMETEENEKVMDYLSIIDIHKASSRKAEV